MSSLIGLCGLHIWNDTFALALNLLFTGQGSDNFNNINVVCVYLRSTPLFNNINIVCVYLRRTPLQGNIFSKVSSNSVQDVTFKLPPLRLDIILYYIYYSILIIHVFGAGLFEYMYTITLSDPVIFKK